MDRAQLQRFVEIEEPRLIIAPVGEDPVYTTNTVERLTLELQQMRDAVGALLGRIQINKQAGLVMYGAGVPHEELTALRALLNPLTDRRDVCGCHRECTTLPHTCDRPCIWPTCLTDDEHRQLADNIERDL